MLTKEEMPACPVGHYGTVDWQKMETTHYPEFAGPSMAF